MLRGDLGDSLYFNQPVVTVLFSHIGATIQLTVMAFTISLISGIVIGVLQPPSIIPV